MKPFKLFRDAWNDAESFEELLVGIVLPVIAVSFFGMAVIAMILAFAFVIFGVKVPK